MTEDLEPRGSEAYQDPLHISPESKADGTSYQWFSTAIFGEKDRARRPTDGWEVVPRSSMSAEWSDSDEFIQRNEIRLYQRPQELTDEALKEDLDEAMRLVGHLESMRRGDSQSCGFAGGSWQSTANAERLTNAAQVGRDKLRTGLKRHPRGRILVIYEEKCSPCAVRFVARHWRALARLRAVWISKDETDVMLLDGVDSATWAWCKRDLLREGAFYRRYLDISTQPRPRRPSKIKPRVVAAWRWCRKQVFRLYK